MAWFKKKPDPISDRARALNQEIADLEARIKRLDAHVQRQGETTTQPRLRSTAIPHGPTITYPPGTAPDNGERSRPASHEPVFEAIDRGRLEAKSDPDSTPDHYNDIGVRKYDLPALLRRLNSQFRGPATTNPKLVSYLAAGGIQGLRPLRYEKRVARNRFIALSLALLLILLGLVAVFLRNR